jgi:hypothetical protein
MKTLFQMRHGYCIKGALALICILVAAGLSACAGEDKPAEPGQTPESGFTFFDVGADTRFSDDLRERLSERLNNDAIQYRTLIDLEFNRKGFLQAHFPVLHELNSRLNSPAGERVEHNTIKLMYRYAVKKDLPFNYVEILFSNYTQKPLYIYIQSEKEISEVIETLRQKYGQPKIIAWDEGRDRTLYWQKEGQFFLASTLTTRLGDFEYRLVIYYVDNLEALIAAEEEERRLLEEQRQKAGRKAF